LAKVAANPNTTSKDLGVPLLPAEHDEMVRRYSLGEVVGKITAIAANSRYFGGVSVDQASGGIIDIGIVDPTSAAGSTLLALLRHVIPSADPIKVVASSHPWTDLETADKRITGDVTNGRLIHLGVVGSALKKSSEVIYLADDAPATAEESLKRMYPDDFVVTERVAKNGITLNSRNFLAGPLYGGEWISNDVDGSMCTMGFGKAIYPPGTGGSYWAVTAGHCGYYLDPWRQGKDGYGGNHFGKGAKYQAPYYSGYANTTQRCDCQAIGPVPSSAVTSQMFTNGNSLYPFTSIAQNTSTYFYIGEPVCHSGAHYAEDHSDNVNCGDIQKR